MKLVIGRCARASGELNPWRHGRKPIGARALVMAHGEQSGIEGWPARDVFLYKIGVIENPQAAAIMTGHSKYLSDQEKWRRRRNVEAGAARLRGENIGVPCMKSRPFGGV